MSFNSFLNKIGNRDIRRGLYYSNLDGIVWAIMFGLAENYIVPFALFFGASVFQTSLMWGLGQLGTGVSQLGGAAFINKFKRRRILSITCNAIHSISWVLIFFFTALTKNPWPIIVFYSMGLIAANFGVPGWLSWMNDLMPGKVRGEYWGMRNAFMGIAQFLAISAGGITLYLAKKYDFEELAFGFLFIAGFAFRFSSVFFLNRQYEPVMKVTRESHTFKFYIFLQKLFTTNFGRFVLYIILLQFSANLVGPILPVYLLKGMHFNYLQFMVVIMVGAITPYILMTYWGPLSDRYGNYRILIISSLALPLIGLGWVFIRNFYLMIILQIFSGFVWSGVSLATSNFIFDAVRRENMSKVMSYYNTLNQFCIFLGAVTGGYLADLLIAGNFHFSILNGFTAVFLISVILRIIVIWTCRKSFREVRETEKSPRFHYFFIYKPAMDMINFIQGINERVFRKRLP